MDRNNFNDKLNKLESASNTYKKYLTFMIGANLILTVLLLMTFSRERIILVPEVSPEYKMWVSNSKVSPEYLNVLSRNTLDLLLNITPSNIEAQYKELLKTVDSKYTDTLKAKLDEITKQIKDNNLSQNFYIENIRILDKSNVVYVKGALNQYIDAKAARLDTEIYRLTFTVKSHMVKLKDIELIKPDDSELRSLK